MKRILSLAIAAAIFLCACGQTVEEDIFLSDEGHDYTAKILAEFIISDIGRSSDEFQIINDAYDAGDFSQYIELYYGLSEDYFEDCAIFRASDGGKADEISLFKLNENADINTVFNNLETYRHNRHGDFFGYAPEQAALCDEAIVSISSDGRWAAIFICPEAQKADEAFFARLGMSLPEDYYSAPEPEPENVPIGSEEGIYLEDFGQLPYYWIPYVDPEIDDMTLWDNTEFVAAVKAGDDYYLSHEERVLFEVVIGILNNIIVEDMSDIEKERAVYEWLTSNCKYDYRHYDVPNNAPRESYEAIGTILSRKAVCLGFANAFQLFMDILDIECITVVGAAFDSEEDHAWNMVRIDGIWYCVDTTWDLGMPPEYFNYFNRSSDYFAVTSHQWDYAAYPIAMPEEIGSYE